MTCSKLLKSFTEAWNHCLSSGSDIIFSACVATLAAHGNPQAGDECGYYEKKLYEAEHRVIYAAEGGSVKSVLRRA
jgi:hypothetical protein